MSERRLTILFAVFALLVFAYIGYTWHLWATGECTYWQAVARACVIRKALDQ